MPSAFLQSPRSLWPLMAVALVSAVFSVAAVADRATGFRGFPRPITKALAVFIEPGVAAWWVTLGDVFQSFPHDFIGYVATVTFNVALWLVGFALARGTLGWLRRRVNSSRSQ